MRSPARPSPGKTSRRGLGPLASASRGLPSRKTWRRSESDSGVEAVQAISTTTPVRPSEATVSPELPDPAKFWPPATPALAVQLPSWVAVKTPRRASGSEVRTGSVEGAGAADALAPSEAEGE